jgi:hypothetical protein
MIWAPERLHLPGSGDCPSQCNANAGRKQAARLCRQYFQQQAAALEDTVVPKLPTELRTAWSAERFVAAASALRASIMAPLSNRSPCVIPGLEKVRHLTPRPHTMAGFIRTAQLHQVNRELVLF